MAQTIKSAPINTSAFKTNTLISDLIQLDDETQMVQIITKVGLNSPKEHFVDARCISGHPMVSPLGYVYYQKKVRCHNRQLHKFRVSRGGLRKANQSPYETKGFRLFDRVDYKGNECFVFGRRTSGYFDLRTLGGTHIHKSASYKELNLIEHSRSFLIERRTSAPPMTEVTGVRADAS